MAQLMPTIHQVHKHLSDAAQNNASICSPLTTMCQYNWNIYRCGFQALTLYLCPFYDVHSTTCYNGFAHLAGPPEQLPSRCLDPSKCRSCAADFVRLEDQYGIRRRGVPLMGAAVAGVGPGWHAVWGVVWQYIDGQGRLSENVQGF